jgi:flagellar secretion chaperone FliS
MNPYASPQAYRDTSVLTASPEQLVVMLYDGAVRFLRQAEVAMDEHAWQHGFDRLSRGEAIIDELLATLDMSVGEVAERLQALYVFFKEHLSSARLEQDASKVEHVAGFMGELRTAWAGIASAS